MSDGTTGKPLYRKMFPEECLNRFVFSADGQRFATGGKKITFYETATGKELFAPRRRITVLVCAIAKDERRWALPRTPYGASQVRLWDLAQETVSTNSSPVSPTSPSGAAFSADGKLVLLTTHSSLRL